MIVTCSTPTSDNSGLCWPWCRALRTTQRGHLDESGVFRLEPDFQRSDDDHGRHRSRRAPLGDPGSDGYGQLPRQGGHAAAHAATSTRARTRLRFKHRRGGMTTTVQPSCDTSRDGSAPSSTPSCALCPRPVPNPRARYCSPAHRQRAFRLRNVRLAAIDERQLRAELRQRGALVAHTVYECSVCGERQVGDRRCAHDNVCCRALGLGGYCNECEQPILLAELLELEVMPQSPDPQFIPSRPQKGSPPGTPVPKS